MAATIKQHESPYAAASNWMDHLWTNSKWHTWILLAISFLIYINTLGHSFVLDDGIVITENEFVKKGISGIPDILANDTFRGFFKKAGKEKLVSGGRYRPFSLIVFAFIYELAGPSPAVFHFFNILMYMLLVWVMYKAFCTLLQYKFPNRHTAIAFLAGLIFAVHPVHTECVANIKGMDEILALMFCLASLHFAVLFSAGQTWLRGLLAASFLFLGILSKENAISYLGVIPLAVLLLTPHGLKRSVFLLLLLSISALFYILIRGEILGFNPFSAPSRELMNNPFMKYENHVIQPMNANEKWGIISHSLLKYLQLLVFPHPLTHDYYPKFIPMEGMASVKSIASIAIHLGLIGMALVCWRRKPTVSFVIAAYLLPLVLVSNIVFPIGTNLGERFLFMPSAAFSLGCSLAIYPFLVSRKSMVFPVLLLALFTFCYKTITRNGAWKDNLTLFLTDVRTSKNSAKIHNALAGMRMESLRNTKDSAKVAELSREAIMHLNKALAIHPVYAEAYLQLGNAYFYLKEYTKSIEAYQTVLKILPEEEDAYKNLQIAHREFGRHIGMTTGNTLLAKEHIKKAIDMKPDDEEAYMLMGIAEGTAGNQNEALSYFQKAAEINPKNPQVFVNIGIAYRHLNNIEKSDEALQKAKSLDPDILKKNGLER